MGPALGRLSRAPRPSFHRRRGPACGPVFGSARRLAVILLLSLLTTSCAGTRDRPDAKAGWSLPNATQDRESPFLAGADLSFVNEREDCGAVYRANGAKRDPFEILADAGMNAVRVRVWVHPTRTNYSTLEDAARTIGRAKALGLHTMLDFHYSDDWADPGKQVIPVEWATDLQDTAALAERVRRYTVDSLSYLGANGLMPDIVQVGNEVNTEILRPAGTRGWPIDWQRNATLLNAGIDGVRAMAGRYETTPKVLLHIAQPENVEFWFDAALEHGVTDFDYIGISYYPYWSTQSIRELGKTVAAVREKYGKDVLVVETGYEWTHEADSRPESSPQMEPGYPPSIDGQRRFLVDVSNAVLDAGGVGVFYWEPADVPTPCSPRMDPRAWTRALFDIENGNELLPGAEFFGVIADRGNGPDRRGPANESDSPSVEPEVDESDSPSVEPQPDKSESPRGEPELDEHTSRSSLDWAGTYEGVVPCADCEGIETSIVLDYDDTFVLRTTYLGKSDEVFEQRGTVVWDERGGAIRLDVPRGAVHYLVGENVLIQLDREGNRITGDLAPRYRLAKVR